MTASAVEEREDLDLYGLKWLSALQGSTLYHKGEVVSRFGEEFWDEVITRMDETTIFPRWLCELLLDDYLAYLLARATLADKDEPLVANLLPDQAQHIFILYTKEWLNLCMSLAGEPIHHDPASESALVNTAAATAKTVGLFQRHNIGYHPMLWEDHHRFPGGALAVPTGIRPRPAV